MWNKYEKLPTFLSFFATRVNDSFSIFNVIILFINKKTKTGKKKNASANTNKLKYRVKNNSPTMKKKAITI